MSLVGNGSGEMSSSYWLGRCTVDILGLEKTRKKEEDQIQDGAALQNSCQKMWNTTVVFGGFIHNYVFTYYE